MTERERILNKIYKTCFRYKEVEEAFNMDWLYIYQLLQDGNEDEVSDVVLEMIELWLDTAI